MARGEGRELGGDASEKVGPQFLFPHSQSRSVPIMLWTREHRAFAVEAYFSNGRSISPFTFPAVSTNRTCATGVLKMHANFTKPLSFVSVLPFGAQFRRSRSLVLIFLRKTSALSRWMQLDTGRWSKNFSFHIWKKWTSRMFGFNETEPRPSMELLRKHFPGRIISLRADLPWLARSPDFAPCDFFLWGYLKSIVYNDRPRTLAHLKTNIRNAIAEIPVDMLQRVARNFRNRLNQCIDNGGRHLTYVIFKTAWKKIWWGDL